MDIKVFIPFWAAKRRRFTVELAFFLGVLNNEEVRIAYTKAQGLEPSCEALIVPLYNTWAIRDGR